MLKESEIHCEVMGSDHCPISLKLSLEQTPPKAQSESGEGAEVKEADETQTERSNEEKIQEQKP